jgi:hypothetical protein
MVITSLHSHSHFSKTTMRVPNFWCLCMFGFR